jgi:hypothetical protein
MCDLNSPFKLCTCDEEIDKSKPWWELNRRKIKNPDMPVIGSVRSGISPFMMNQEFIKKQINSDSVFDFDYKPRTNDQLIIHYPGDESLILHYQWGRWTDYRENVGAKIINEKLLHTGNFEPDTKAQG